MLRSGGISISQRILYQPCQKLSQSRTFSSILDGEKPAAVEEKVVEKEKDSQPRVKKESRKSSKDDTKTVNKKQQLDILQQFYDASEAALKYAIRTN